MGSWSHEPFGNDTACDWGNRFATGKDLTYLEATLDTVLAGDPQQLEEYEEEEAIAAAEVLAKLLGKDSQRDAYTARVDNWIAAHGAAPGRALLEKGQQALARIVRQSKLRDAWETSAHFAAWQAGVARLESAITPT
jgi:hypothetical protein